MAGYLGSLNSFHSFRENKTALRAHPLVALMFLLRPRRNVYHMEKQSPQRFTTGILTQQETQKRRVRQKEGKKKKRRRWREGSLGDLMMGGKEKRSGAERPEAGRAVYTQTESGITGD